MSHKVDVLAYDREKRVYKDAYVSNFRRVRHFPALATVGAGRSDGDSIILVQDSSRDSAEASSQRRSKHADVESRVIPVDPLEGMFPSAPPLTSFRTAVMCKHTNARQEIAAAPTIPAHSGQKLTSGWPSRYIDNRAKTIFKPTSVVEAKSAIERRTSYDNDAYQDRLMIAREQTSPQGKPKWGYINPISAKEDVRAREYFHLPPDDVVKANKAYTVDFIDRHVEAYRFSRQQVTRLGNQS